MMSAALQPVPVSIILPTFNRLQYLPAAVESVFSQTFENWELIIADDGSGQETRAYLDSLGQRHRVKVVALPHSGNPGTVRNAALSLARGHYIAFLDSDDLWMPRKLELQLAVLRASPARQWSYTEFIRIDHAGHSIDSQRNPHRVLHDGWIVEHLLRLKVGIAMPTVIVARDLLEHAGGFDSRQRLHEDYELWLRLALLSEVTVVTTPLACVRRHDAHFSYGGIGSLHARRRVLMKMRHLVRDRRHRSVLRVERARNRAALATAAVRAVARRVVPAWLLAILRRPC